MYEFVVPIRLTLIDQMAHALTKRTRLIAEKAAEQGITPLEVMLANMWYFYELAESAEKALEKIIG
jgi:hypothetical protein